ncbi:MAG TPA: hypothetical protein PLF81_08740 [Candidatus Anammoximicrobium sp.]|nr:hypothetical protein [Candidatus Anammoximicrobium sp.]
MMTTFQPLPLQSAAGACAAAGLRPRGRACVPLGISTTPPQSGSQPSSLASAQAAAVLPTPLEPAKMKALECGAAAKAERLRTTADWPWMSERRAGRGRDRMSPLRSRKGDKHESS